MEDIPDSIYRTAISTTAAILVKYVKSLLSNIVREENEQELSPRMSFLVQEVLPID